MRLKRMLKFLDQVSSMGPLDPTKQRLLEAAGEEFAERGFEGATVRQICQRADANVAAINYHFGDKEQLYTQAVIEAHRCGTGEVDGFVPPDSLDDSPDLQLRLYIRHFLDQVLSISRRPTWHNRLMLREMVQPTQASEALVREFIRPKFDHLVGILARICPEADAQRLHVLAFSVVGQCLHYRMAHAISRRLIGDEQYDALDLDFLTDHIAGFCLAALGLVPPLDAAGRTLPLANLTTTGEPSP
jgi:AcrR family transcriptional regulator